jgi:hypothetical protein
MQAKLRPTGVNSNGMFNCYYGDFFLVFSVFLVFLTILKIFKFFRIFELFFWNFDFF